jgi:hypothetical protein
VVFYRTSILFGHDPAFFWLPVRPSALAARFFVSKQNDSTVLEVRTEFLIIIQMSFGLKGLMKYKKLIDVRMECRTSSVSWLHRNRSVCAINTYQAQRIKTNRRMNLLRKYLCVIGIDIYTILTVGHFCSDLPIHVVFSGVRSSCYFVQ